MQPAKKQVAILTPLFCLSYDSDRLVLIKLLLNKDMLKSSSDWYNNVLDCILFACNNKTDYFSAIRNKLSSFLNRKFERFQSLYTSG